MADLHGGAEDDGHVLETHLVEALPLDHVHHVHKNPLNQISEKKRVCEDRKFQRFSAR